MSDLETEFWVFLITERDKKGSVVAGFLMKLLLFAAGLLVVLVFLKHLWLGMPPSVIFWAALLFVHLILCPNNLAAVVPIAINLLPEYTNV